MATTIAPPAPRFTARQAATLVRKAGEAAVKASQAATPAPMVVGTAKSLFDDSFDLSKPVYKVDEGVCGFAWVWFPRANDSFARRALAAGLTAKCYDGGMRYRIPTRSQSLARNEAAARAAAAVFAAAELVAYPQSRMD
jgi:hypothetical protein